MPPTFTTDAGNTITPNAAQVFLWACWLDFCRSLSAFELDAIIINGDVPNGVNFRDSQILSPNENDQRRFGIECLTPLIRNRTCPIYMIRGTGFHAGGAGSREEMIADAIGAEPDETGHFSRWFLWYQWREKKVFATHHTPNARVYPHTPLWRQLNSSKIRAVDGWPLADVNVRSHVHMCNALEDNKGRWIATVPSWQMPTEFVWKVAPDESPAIGGLIFWQDEEGQINCKRKLYDLPLPHIETATVRTICPASNKS
jgi:hypothetical protein